jgi:hypothetical protein
MSEQEKIALSQVTRVLRQPAADHEREEAKQPAGQVQRDPLQQVACRAGDASCANAQAGTLSRATDGRLARGRGSLLRLQREYGNRFVRRVVELSRKGQGEGDVTPETEAAIQRERGGGQGLDSATRGQMEPALNADFSGVRVHTGSQADTLNRDLGARAFTTGQDIFFKHGEYSPGSSGGRELLAHELTHVVQQDGDRVKRKLTVGAADDQYEQEADRVARQAMSETDAAQRQAEKDTDEEPSQGSLQTQSAYRSPALQMRARLSTMPVRGLSRQMLQRKVDTWGGSWDTDQYDLVAAAGGVRGLDIKLRFDPGQNADAELIGLTQSVQDVVNSTPVFVDTAEEDRSIKKGEIPINTGPGETDKGTAIDQADFNRNPLYAVERPPASDMGLADTTPSPSTVAAGNQFGQHGFRFRDVGGRLKQQSAILIDTPRRAGVGRDARMVFETTALAIRGAQTGTYYGSVRWGWRTSSTGLFTQLPLTKVSEGVPSSTFMKAAQIWNDAKTSAGAETIDLPVVDVKVTTATITGVYPPGFVGPPSAIPAGTRVQILQNAAPPNTNGRIKVVDGPFTGQTLEIRPADMANLRDERP